MAREYAPSKTDSQGAGSTTRWTFQNHAQGFQAFLSDKGWEVVRPSAWRWSYRLASIARGTESKLSSPPKVSERDQTIYLTYSDGVTEWYKNSLAGIEQGFEISSKPFANRTEELVLVGKVDTDLSVSTSTRDKIGFSHQGKEVFQYAGLKVVDSKGRTLPSWLSSDGRNDAQRLRIHIDDSHAVYPVLVDPLASSPAWSIEGNQANSRFGQSVASAGDINNDGFDDLLVGAPDFTNGHTKEGKVFLYLGSIDGLASTPAWSAEANKANSFFGGTVASAGDVNQDGYVDVLIGAQGYSNGQTQEGRAYLYLGSASGLLTTPAWIIESNSAVAFLGSAVASAGDINKDGFGDIIIGAYQTENGESNEGRAFVYMGSASGPSTTPTTILEANQAVAHLGSAVASAGDVNNDGFSDIVVGAAKYSNGHAYEGRAYVFLGSAAGLSTSPIWVAEGQADSANFGCSVASGGDVNGDGFSDILVGADGISNGHTLEGRAYLYLSTSAGPSGSPIMTWEGEQDNALMGNEVASAGDIDRDGYTDVLIGAPRYSNGETEEGRAFLFLGSSSGASSTAAWTSESNQANSLHALGLNSAGDVNGDGYSDVAVGTMRFSNGESQEGRAAVHLGSGEPGDLNGDKVPDTAMLGKGQVAQVIVNITGTPLPMLVGGTVLAADVGQAPGSASSSLITATQQGSSFEWASTSAFTMKSRVFKTTASTGTPMTGCHLNGEYTAAAFITNGTSSKVRLYGSSSNVDIALPSNTIAARCSPPLSGTSAVLSLVKHTSQVRKVVASKAGKTLFTSRALPSNVTPKSIKLGVLPRSNGKPPTAMVLAKSGGRSKLLVRDKSNRWQTIPVRGVPSSSQFTDFSAIRTRKFSYIVIQITSKTTAISYKSVRVKGKYL